MFGMDMGNLKLYLIQNGVKSLVWGHHGPSRSSKDDTPWQQVSLTFYPYSDYKFVFEAHSGSAYRSDMAIDDVIISQNMCISCLGEGLFDCKDDSSQECILAEFRCDGIKDCQNGADEINCLPEEKLEQFEDFCQSHNIINLPACRSATLANKCFNTTTVGEICDGKWDCMYGYDEAGCEETNAALDDCGLPDPEPRMAQMGWAKGRAKFEEKDHRWLWTGALYYKNKFECSVHMVATNWYITSLECVLKGMTKQKKISQWYDFRGCKLKENSETEKKIDPANFKVHHVSLNDPDKPDVFNIERILIHPTEISNQNMKRIMVLINTRELYNSNDDSRRSICLNSLKEKRFRFDIERPQLCTIVGYRFEQERKYS